MAQPAERPEVVVTHFEPPPLLVVEVDPKLWVWGHRHGFSDRMFADTRVVRNALGYPLQVHSVDEMPRQDFVVEFGP